MKEFIFYGFKLKELVNGNLKYDAIMKSNPFLVIEDKKSKRRIIYFEKIDSIKLDSPKLSKHENHVEKYTGKIILNSGERIKFDSHENISNWKFNYDKLFGKNKYNNINQINMSELDLKEEKALEDIIIIKKYLPILMFSQKYKVPLIFGDMKIDFIYKKYLFKKINLFLEKESQVNDLKENRTDLSNYMLNTFLDEFLSDESKNTDEYLDYKIKLD